jgi:Tuberculosis necrotizing toxin
MIDRFGAEDGSFFSPKGESFASRAVPYVCKQMDYRVYEVRKSIPVKVCKAAPWFDEPGGATQDQTEKAGKPESASDLVANGSIKVVTYVVGGGSGPFPQCGGP